LGHNIEIVRPEADKVAVYRRQIFDLLVGLMAVGIIAQDVAAMMTGASIKITLLINVVCTGLLILSWWGESRFHPRIFSH